MTTPTDTAPELIGQRIEEVKIFSWKPSVQTDLAALLWPGHGAGPLAVLTEAVIDIRRVDRGQWRVRLINLSGTIIGRPWHDQVEVSEAQCVPGLPEAITACMERLIGGIND